MASDGYRFEPFARRAITHWIAHMRRTTCVGALCRQIGLPRPIRRHIVDEIAIGAERCDLERRLSDVMIASLSEARGGNAEALFASCAGPLINGFIERLEIESPATSASLALARGRVWAPLLSEPETTAPLAESSVARPLAVAWGDAFGSLVDANLVATRHSSGRETDRELARLLAQVPVDIVEAES